MEFKQYPSYKPSGVEWLGDVPDEWDIYPFWHLFNRKEITNKTQEQLLSVYLDRGVILHSEGGGMVHKPADNLEKYQLVEVNDFVMNNQQAWRGSVGVSPYKGIVSPAYLIFSFNKKICAPKFFKYFLRDKGVVDQFMIASMSVGTIQRQVKWHLLKTIQLSIPSLIEQNTIANFLDTETARIDNLIAKQEKLIELLEEQRKSIISHAVSKGLNPNAPMKDSGVEWLGDVPEHWEVISIKFLAHCSSGQGINSLEVLDIADDKNSFPVIGGNGMMGWTSKSNYKEPVLSIGRVGALCGNVHLINYPSWISDNSLILKVYSKKVNLEILQYILLSRNLNNLASKSAQPLITGTQVKNEKITLPPPNEQSQILQYIIQNQSRINNLIAKQKTLIEKLKEYRASIISHAVTGKIDVREFGA